MKVLLPLPDKDFDITEVAVPWRLLTNTGHSVVFATENGSTAPAADPHLFKSMIFGAAAEAKEFYQQMAASPEFQKPLAWKDINPADYAGIILPGGHAPGMRQYLGSETVQRLIGQFFDDNKPVGAICHGTLVAARSRSSRTGKSVLAAKRTTCFPKYMEKTSYYLTAWRMGSYARTYPTYVEDEVHAVLDNPSQLQLGPKVLRKKGTMTDDSAAFVVQDGNYLSARWPGDAYLFAKKFIELLKTPGASVA